MNSLREIVKVYFGTLAKFSKATGINPVIASNLVCGRRRLSDYYLARIQKAIRAVDRSERKKGVVVTKTAK